MRRLFAPTILLLAAAACSSVSSTAESQKHFAIASALTKVSSAVETTVRYEAYPATLADEELVKFATSGDPSATDMLKPYRVKVLAENKHAVLLVCEPDRDEAVFEDAGCTAAVDRHHWQSKPAPACQFTLKVADVCSQ